MTEVYKRHYKVIIPYRPDLDVPFSSLLNSAQRELEIIWRDRTTIEIHQSAEDHKMPRRFDGKVEIFLHFYFEFSRHKNHELLLLLAGGIMQGITESGLKEYFFDDWQLIGFDLNQDQERPRVELTLTHYGMHKRISIQKALAKAG